MDAEIETAYGHSCEDEKKRRLYQEQVALLNTFLAKGAISKRQYDKSYNDLTEKMGFQSATSGITGEENT